MSTIENLKVDRHRPGPPKVSPDHKPEFVEKMVKIIDADVIEELGNEDDPSVSQTLWLLLQDTESNSIFRSPLSLEDIQSITGLSRQLQGRELFKFADALKDRKEPLKLVVDLNSQDVDTSMILAKTAMKSEEQVEQELTKELDEIGLSKPEKIAQVSRFQFEPNKAQKTQQRVNNE
jgi:hypothetical protein